MTTLSRTSIAALATAAALAATGCGSSDSSSDSTSTAAATTEATTTEATTTTTPAATAQKAVEMVMTEFKFDPSQATVAAGKVKITQVNKGAVKHEFVLLQSDKPAGSFKVKGGEIDEADVGKNMGEIEDVEPGGTKSKTFDLKPGKYVFVCNLPGHYAGGMYGSLTVK